jgi:hypothetical protein
MHAPLCPQDTGTDAGALHTAFVALVPRIERHGRIYFRHVRCRHKKADAIQEMTALGWRWFLRLHERGKDPAEFLTGFTTLLARAVNSGRRLVGMAHGKDAANPATQRRHHFAVEVLPSSLGVSHERRTASPHGQELQDAYEERLRDNTITPVVDQVQFRIDFPAWLATWPERDRQLIEALGLGERTLALAEQFGLTPGRISQKRREYHGDWERFCGDRSDDQPAPVEGGAG